MVEPRGQGGLVPEVARQEDHVHARIARRQLAQQRRRAVARAVVDEHQFETQTVQRGADARVELLDRPFLVVDGSDDAE